MADWCLDELRHKATLVPDGSTNAPPLVVYNGDVVKSDNIVPVEFKTSLQDAVKLFQDKIPERLKDWHPGSDEKVWDLVHPSLFPLVYGRTRVLANRETTTLEDCIEQCGRGEITQVPPKKETYDSEATRSASRWPRNPLKNPFSAKFQWLPCEVDIFGEEAMYVRNLQGIFDHERRTN